jgi:hypothetical protein
MMLMVLVVVMMVRWLVSALYFGAIVVMVMIFGSGGYSGSGDGDGGDAHSCTFVFAEPQVQQCPVQAAHGRARRQHQGAAKPHRGAVPEVRAI